MLTAECRLAIERLQAALGGAAPADALGTALGHFQSCPLCRARLAQLGGALASVEEDALSCRHCQERLPELLLARQAGQADTPEWRPVLVHLRTCPHCAEALAELAELAELPGADAEQPAVRQRGQLPVAGERHWTLDGLGRLMITLSAELLRALQPAAHAQAAVKRGPGPAVLLHLEVSAGGLAVTLTAEQERDDAERCALTVAVRPPGRGWPDLGGTEVALSCDEQALAAGITSAFGRAVFPGISTAELPRLVITISPAP